MCLSKSIVSTLFVGFAWMLASLLVAAKEEVRVDLELDAAVWKRILGSALLFTIPVAATIKLLQDWGESTSQLCIGKVTFLLVAFASTLPMVLLDVIDRHFRVASGEKLSRKYHGTRFLFFLIISFAFFVIRLVTGLA